jgi:hypothetical protein
MNGSIRPAGTSRAFGPLLPDEVGFVLPIGPAEMLKVKFPPQDWDRRAKTVYVFVSAFGFSVGRSTLSIESAHGLANRDRRGRV